MDLAFYIYSYLQEQKPRVEVPDFGVFRLEKEHAIMDAELLNAVDLSTYGLKRVKFGAKIELNPSEAELEPQNPNLRGAHIDDDKKDPLNEIIRNFNEK